MKEQVIEALKKVRPALQRDGGDIELVSVEENGVVKVRLKGKQKFLIMRRRKGNCQGSREWCQ